jgi:hypothetical protein
VKTKHTPLPWKVDLTYPTWPAIRGSDGSTVNVDYENASDAFLIVRTINTAHGFEKEAAATAQQEAEYIAEQERSNDCDYVEWWGVPVRLR